MPDIGATLRETRMRRKIDISEVETNTKIRAKYLRALENEEWDLLPGPTFVKTFLRTYAEYLEIDPKLLVEEYKARYERPRPDQLTPFAPHLGGRRDRRRARGPRLGPGVVLALGVVVVVVLLGVLGTLADDDPDAPVAATEPPAPVVTEPAPQERADERERSPERRRTPRVVRLQIEPTAPVWVCLVDARGRELIDGRPVAPGDEDLGPFRSRRFRITLGNGNATLRINGRRRPVPQSSDGIGYDIRRDGSRRTLSLSARPDCA